MSTNVSLAPRAAEAQSAVAAPVPAPQGSAGSAPQSKVQMVGRSVVGDAAIQGAEHVKAGVVEIRRYIHENHFSVRIFSFCIAIALLVFSFLGVLNVFNAVFSPYQYLFAFYNAVFSVVIIVADGKLEWFTKCGDLQTKLFSNATFLASPTGRALFYFYVGSINLFMLPSNPIWQMIYLTIGGAMCLNGALMLMDTRLCCCSGHRRMPEEVMQEVP
jgi:hypothetical protein